MEQHAVVTVIGRDQTGIIAKVATLLAEQNANILDVSQTIMDSIFTMSMLIDVTNVIDFSKMQAELNTLGETIGVTIHTQREEIFDAMSKI